MNVARFGLVAFMVLSGCRSLGPRASETRAFQQQGWDQEESLVRLRAGVQSEDPAIRAAAVSAWIDSNHPSGQALDAWVLADPSVHVQRSAAMAGRIHNRSLSIHPTTDRVAQLWTEGHRDEAWFAELKQALRDGMFPADPDLLTAFVEQEGASLGPLLVEGASMAEEPMQLPIALAAVRVGAPGAMKALGDAIEAGDDERRLIAIESLTEHGDDDAIEWLKRASRRGDTDAGLHARLALVAFGKQPASVALEALGSSDRDTREWAVKCLGMSVKVRALPREAILRLQGSVRDESPAVKRASVRALYAVKGIEMVPLGGMSSAIEPDAVSLMVAGKWLARTGVQAPQ